MAFDIWLLALTSAFTFVYGCAYVYAYAYAYACVCPVPMPMPGPVRLCRQFICYVSTHFRYILTTLVLIRNTFPLSAANPSNTGLFDKAAKKQIDKQGNFG